MNKLLVIIAITTSITVLGVMGLKSDPIQPYISEIEASSNDLSMLTKELDTFSLKSGKNIMSSGNYPITIGFEVFNGEDIDSLGYALVGNYGCDIKLNLSEKWNKSKFRLVLYHELGHCFGLDHKESMSIMAAEYDDDKKQNKSLPDFYYTMKNIDKEILLSDSGIKWWDDKLNEFLDRISPESKDSFRRKEFKVSHPKLKIKNNESKKIDYENQ